MTNHNWDRIGSLFHAALERAPDQRAAFLIQACEGNEELRREVAEMLVAHGAAGRLEVEDRLLADDVLDPLDRPDHRSLPPGTAAGAGGHGRRLPGRAERRPV